METSHTPGPWVKEGLHWIGGNGEIVVIADGPSFGSASSFKNARANAMLIAAAPDLLEALENILSERGGDYGDTDYQSLWGAIERSKSAIAKAKGEI